jgi:predicted Fe-Mo cluster-binding NifX family protein
MKIAASSTGKTLESAVAAYFGRCPYFLIINPATLEFEAIANENADQGGGAGLLSAQLIADKKVSVVLTGSCGPYALKIFERASIQVITGVSGSVSQAVKQYTDGILKPAPSVQAPPSASVLAGRRTGAGRGIGVGGRRMGGGGPPE